MITLIEKLFTHAMRSATSLVSNHILHGSQRDVHQPINLVYGRGFARVDS